MFKQHGSPDRPHDNGDSNCLTRTRCLFNCSNHTTKRTRQSDIEPSREFNGIILVPIAAVISAAWIISGRECELLSTNIFSHTELSRRHRYHHHIRTF